MRYNIFYNQSALSEKMVVFERSTGNRIARNPLSIFDYMLNDIRFGDYTFIWSINRHESIPHKYKNLPQVIFVKRYTDLYYKYLSRAGLLVNDTTFPTFFILKNGQKYLNTWHGTPWKTLGYDIKNARMDYSNATRNFLQTTHLLLPNKYSYEYQIVPHQLASI